MSKGFLLSGWLSNCHSVISNHYNLRPETITKTSEVNLLVIHCISLNGYGSDEVENLFCGKVDGNVILSRIQKKSGRLSAHFYIKRSGERLQFVPIHYRAWHAGVSQYLGRKDCNDFSIGIELEGKVSDTFTDDQYKSLVLLSNTIMTNYSQEISVVGHDDIAPERKFDPGKGFNWNHYHSLLSLTRV